MTTLSDSKFPDPILSTEESLGGDVDDTLLASTLDDYEKTQQQQSSINLSGLLQGATASHVNINININGR